MYPATLKPQPNCKYNTLLITKRISIELTMRLTASRKTIR